MSPEWLRLKVLYRGCSESKCLDFAPEILLGNAGQRFGFNARSDLFKSLRDLLHTKRPRTTEGKHVVDVESLPPALLESIARRAKEPLLGYVAREEKDDDGDD